MTNGLTGGALVRNHLGSWPSEHAGTIATKKPADLAPTVFAHSSDKGQDKLQVRSGPPNVPNSPRKFPSFDGWNLAARVICVIGADMSAGLYPILVAPFAAVSFAFIVRPPLPEKILDPFNWFPSDLEPKDLVKVDPERPGRAAVNAGVVTGFISLSVYSMAHIMTLNMGHPQNIVHSVSVGTRALNLLGTSAAIWALSMIRKLQQEPSEKA